MVKKIIAVASSFLMLFCIVPFAAFADVLDTCPKCGERTYVQETGLTVDACGIGVTYNTKHCTSCRYSYYEWSLFGRTGYKEFESGTGDNLVADFISEWIWANFGKNANFKKYETGGGSADGSSGVGRHPSGYDSNNSALVSKGGSKRVRATFKFFKNSTSLTTVNEYFSDGTANYVLGVPGKLTLCVGGTASTSAAFSFSGGYFPVEYEPGYYTLPIGTQILNFNYNQGSTSYPSTPSANFTPLFVKTTGVRSFCYNPSKSSYNRMYYFYANSYNFSSSFIPSVDYVGDSSQNYSFRQSPAGTYNQISAPPDIYLDYTPLDASSTVTSRNNITINNNTWNGNIYQDNSTNLTYIYPQYTTINENNETVTNISENPIIYNNETNEYYTYDSVTNNYYYITYVTETPTPTPSPDPGTDPTPTPTPGGDTGNTGDSVGIIAALVEIRDNLIQGFADLKATLVQGWADLSANFTLAIDNLTINIQNFFHKALGGSTVDPDIPGGGSSTSTPETGDKDDSDSDSSNSGWSWNPLKWLADLLKDVVEKILKGLWKILTSIFGFILWLLSLMFQLFPWMPGSGILALCAGVVVVTIVRIIKFITGR